MFRGFLGTKFSLKIILLNLSILLVPFVIIIGVLYFKIVSTPSTNTYSLIDQRLQQEKEKIDIRISTIEHLGFNVANHIFLKDFFDKESFTDVDFITHFTQYVNPLSEWFSSNSNLVSRITYITNNSQISDTTNIVKYKNIKQEKWVRNIVTKTKLYECYWESLHEQRSYPPFIKARKGYMVHSAYFRMPVRGKNTTYIEVDIQTNDLLALKSGQPVGKYGYIFAVDIGNGRVINSKNILLEEAFLSSRKYQTAIEGFDQYVDFSYNNTTYYISLIKVDRLSVNLVAIVPQKEFLEPLWQTKITFVIWLIIGFLAIIVIAVLSSLYAAYKVRLITEAVRKIQIGEYDINLPDKGQDELDELARNVNVMARRIDELINKVYKSELAYKESMFAALQAKINPHFLLNTLETFRMMIELKGEKDLSDAMEVFGSVIRYNAYSIKKITTLSKELENVSNYSSIQNVLLNNRLQVIYQTEEELSHCLIPSLTLQPVVENSILHGFKSSTYGILRINISIYKEDDDVVIKFADNGCGVTSERLAWIADILKSTRSNTSIGVTKSIGLTNINERIKLKFGNQYGVRISNGIDGKGTVVEIRIPFFIGKT